MFAPPTGLEPVTLRFTAARLRSALHCHGAQQIRGVGDTDSLSSAQRVASFTVSKLCVAGLLLIGLLSLSCHATAAPRTTPVKHAVTKAAKKKAIVVPQTCSVPAPDSAAGYQQMFGQVDPSVWGAGDVSLSVKVGHRSVWLYGDTASQPSTSFDASQPFRFAHSTAIVQDGGCLHVANSGGQILPDGTSPVTATVSGVSYTALPYYWVDSAVAVSPNVLRVTAMEVIATAGGPWGFAGTGAFRAADVSLNEAGDLKFQGWLGYVAQPSTTDRPVKTIIDNDVTLNGVDILDNCGYPGTAHYTYAPWLHPEAHLASGKTLLSLAQNWDDGGVHTWASYRPVFYEVTP